MATAWNILEETYPKMGFLLKTSNSKWTWGPLGSVLRRNLINYWEKSVGMKICTGQKMCEIFQCRASTISHTDEIVTQNIDYIMNHLSNNRPFFLLSLETSKLSRKYFLNAQCLSTYFVTNENDELSGNLNYDLWLRNRKSWWQNIQTNDENFEIVQSDSNERLHHSINYTPFKSHEFLPVVESISHIKKHDTKIVKSSLEIENAIYALLHDSIITDNGKPIGFNIVRSLAPYKVIIFNQCVNKEFFDESVETCKHLRLSLHVAGIETFYEKLKTDDESELNDRWKFFQNLGSPLAVVIDANTITDARFLLTIMHTDSGRREAKPVALARSAILKYLGLTVFKQDDN